MDHLKIHMLKDGLVSRFPDDLVVKWLRPCRPRILMLVDGLDYQSSNGFGLWRFLHSLTVAPGVTTKPILTLAHRGVHATPTVTVGPDTYTIVNNFNFSTAATPVTLASYDQIWIFGINGGAFSLSNAEVAVVSEFMNGGGGVFATGDHASLGRALSGSLPRIRHMREWRDAAAGGVPMGTESNASLAVNRIDTVVNPGSNNLYEFVDQSDDIPQRIYPNYRVTDTDGSAGSAWQATVSPLLMLPGALTIRRSSDASPPAGFSKDIDVLPDHPHESVCYDVTSAAILGGAYDVGGQNFPEFQPNASAPRQRVGADIAAYAVSGGRSVFNGVWKPPVRPRMFGVISAYDGRLAQAYPGKSQRPGRIVCDSTWHHFVNINLDGTGSGRTGLGTGSGAGFVPSAALEKIYSYYRNIVSWLQPANRIWCSIFWDLVAVRMNSALLEELLEVDRLVNWRDLVGLGREAKNLVALVHGEEAVRDQILGLLASEERTQKAADLLMSDSLAASSLDPEEVIDGIYGGLLVEMANVLPADADVEMAQKVLGKGPAAHLARLQERVAQSIQLGVKHQSARMEKGLSEARRLGAVA